MDLRDLRDETTKHNTRTVSRKLNDIDKNVGVSSYSVLASEPTSATQQLIDIQEEVDEIDRCLAARKQDFRIKMHLMRKRREAVDQHELHLKMSLMDMEKYIKENGIKRTRAERKAEEAQDMNKAKDKELERLKDQLNILEQQKRSVYDKLIKNSIYQIFMTRVLDSAADFHEIRGIISRFDTLFSTCQDLREKQQRGEASIKELRMNLFKYFEDHGKEVIRCSMMLAELQDCLCHKQQRVIELESQVSKMTIDFSDKTMIIGKIRISIDNMYDTLNNSRISGQTEEQVTDSTSQLLEIQQSFNDLRELTQDVATSVQSSSKKNHVTIVSTKSDTAASSSMA